MYFGIRTLIRKCNLISLLISNFQFEWAWQNPSISRRLKNLPQKKKTEKVYDYNVRLMYSMLTVAPWCFLPLTVQWLKQEYFRHNPSDVVPPKHMPICYGPIIIKKKPKITSSKLSAGEIKTEFKGQLCNLCWKTVEVSGKLIKVLVSMKYL